MPNPVHPAWPDPATLPFSMFGLPGAPQAGGAGSAFGIPGGGLAGGMDLLRQFWGALPGGSAVPGFLVPTVDVEELDKRISDLRAAESWLEVNLNILRATVQGLEVQRHTIAALHSLSAMADGCGEPKAAVATGGLPAGWPMSQGASSPAPVARPTPAAAPSPKAEATPAPDTSGGRKAADDAAEPGVRPSATSDASGPAAGPDGFPGANAANQWLGFLQDQFARVAQAATASSGAVDPSPPAALRTAAPRKTAATSGRRAAAKSAGRKRAPSR